MGANQFILRLRTINSEQKHLRENVEQKNKWQAQLAPQVVTQVSPNKLPRTTKCLPALRSMPFLISSSLVLGVFHHCVLLSCTEWIWVSSAGQLSFERFVTWFSFASGIYNNSVCQQVRKLSLTLPSRPSIGSWANSKIHCRFATESASCPWFHGILHNPHLTSQKMRINILQNADWGWNYPIYKRIRRNSLVGRAHLGPCKLHLAH